MANFNADICSTQIFKTNKNENYVLFRKYEQHRNRRLSSIERYMKRHGLLFKNEFLEFCYESYKHIRMPYIETIARKRGWILSTEYLRIIHY